MKTIGILTSGGDAPGMNAAVRAVVRSAFVKGMKVFGIRRGYQGLIKDDMFEMELRSVSDIIQCGGTMLYTARSVEFNSPEGVAKAVKICKKRGIEGIVVIGGDGSFRGARDLSASGIPCVGIPATIDNDLACTDYTIGFDTAMNTATQMVDLLRVTSESHDRCSVVEVMGRRAGYLALQTGISVGATAILVPEVEYNVDKDVISRIKKSMKTNKRHFIVIVAEGIGMVNDLSDYIYQKTGIECRPTILGHVQRGGVPTVTDRVMASRMGCHAVGLLAKGIGNRVVVLDHSQIKDIDIFEALAMTKEFDKKLYQVARDISV